MPQEGSDLQFAEGRATKKLILVDKSVTGELVVSGRQLDGNNRVYFFSEDEDQAERVDDTTLRLLKLPLNEVRIPKANETNKMPEPEGKAVQGMGPLFLSPGCYEFTASLGEYTVKVVEKIDP